MISNPVLEVRQLHEPRKIFYREVKSFPEGITEAFRQLLVDFSEREFFGISYMNEEGKIIYFAGAAEHFEGEGAEKGYEPFTIAAGEYLEMQIVGYMDDLDAIGKAFDVLMRDPRIDLTHPCVELYKNDDEMLCMMKTK